MLYRIAPCSYAWYLLKPATHIRYISNGHPGAFTLFGASLILNQVGVELQE